MTAQAPPEANRRETLLDVVIDREGTARGTVTSTLEGARADELRAALQQAGTARDEREAAIDACGIRESGTSMGDVTVDNKAYDGVARPVVVRARVDVRQALASTTGVVSLDATTLLAPWTPHLPSGKRTQPIVLPSLHHTHTTVRARLPGTFETASTPEAVSIDAPFARFEQTWRRDGDAVVLERTVVVKQRLVAPADAEALRAFIDRMNRASTARMILQQK
jgi:hypothetical protein